VVEQRPGVADHGVVRVGRGVVGAVGVAVAPGVGGHDPVAGGDQGGDDAGVDPALLDVRRVPVEQRDQRPVGFTGVEVRDLPAVEGREPSLARRGHEAEAAAAARSAATAS
jgi:hypothetical protein